MVREEIQKAIGAHGLWKGHLKSAIDKGRSEFTVEDAAADNKCEFGRWLYSTVDHDTQSRAHHEKVTRLHREFHQEVGKILGQALAGDRVGALKAMEPGTPYFSCCTRLTDEMMDWNRATAH